MIKILADGSLPNIATTFAKPFVITTYHSRKELTLKLPEHDVLVCRSTLPVDADLLKNSRITCVATASSGIDHIDTHYLTQHNIQLLDAKGSNAIAVADYVMSSLATLQKRQLLVGSKAGVIGVGKVGQRVVQRLIAAGFDVVCYDPLQKIISSKYRYVSLDEIASCDLISVHANWHHTKPYPSHQLINNAFLKQLKPGTTIINASRGHIIDETALLNTNKSIIYCTDVYANEPEIDARIVDFSTICTPHIAGHSIEGKQRVINFLCQKIYDHYDLSHSLLPIMVPKLGRLPLTDWQTIVLQLYDPSSDTSLLKSATNKALAFLSQRAAHQNRHDYMYYDASLLPPQTQQILGYENHL